MFRIPISIAIILLIAFGGATASAVYALKVTIGFGSIAIGGWQAWPLAQTENADPYAKAHRARAGKLLLGGAEGLVFFADRDSDGGRLSNDCTYVVVGQTPPARFWTLHATDENNVLLDVDEEFPSSYHSQNVLKDQSGGFEINVGRRPAPGNWLATGDQNKFFKLVLTLFDTPTAGSSRLIDLQMPDILSEECQDG